ncbi:MAG: hypothetical protein ACFE9D_10150 [Promethearchaeota archaeon]
MNRNIWKIGLLVLSLLLFQFGIPQPMGFAETPSPTVTAISVPVNGMASILVNDTDPLDSFTVQILDPGVYRFNLTYYVNNATPGGVDIDTDWYQPMDTFWPGVGTFFRSLDHITSVDWNNRMENETGYYDTDIICVRPGYLHINYELTSYFTGDWVTGNLTVNQLLSFGALPNAMPLSQNTTLEWTTDYTWQGFRLQLPENSFYNFTAYGSLNWSTTSGWGGDATFYPLDGVVLIDLNYGEYYPYNAWHPVYNVPAGPDENDTVWGPDIESEVLVGGTYYLLALSDNFEFLNDSLTTFTLNVAPIPTTPLIPGIPLPLQFNTTSNVLDAYVAVTIPEGHYFNAYFSNPSGINWTLNTFDAWTGSYTGPSFEIYEDPSTNYTLQDNLERGYATAQSMGFPSPSMMGNLYMEMWMATATYTLYTNGSITGAIPPLGPGISSRFNTFYMYIQANSIGDPHSETFNIVANLDLTPFPELTGLGLNVDFNTTVGPFYHCFTLPQASGAIYSVSATPDEYTTSGTIGLEDFQQSEAYRDWQYFSIYGPPLGFADPPSGTGYSENTNDTAMLTYVAVRDSINYMWVLGPGMVGGDMTSANVSLIITPVTPYAFGTVATASLEPDQFATYSFNVIAGNTYVLTMELIPGGDTVFGYFMTTTGDNPFIIGSLFSSLIGVSTTFPFSMIYQDTFTARFTGRISFALVGEGTVNIIIGVAEGPLSPLMIGAFIGVAVIMLLVGVLVGYLTWKRRVFNRTG